MHTSSHSVSSVLLCCLDLDLPGDLIQLYHPHRALTGTARLTDIMGSLVPMRPLGKHGMQSSAQGLGCMSLSKGFYNEEKSLGPEEDRIGVIREALSSGVTMFDTADAYGPYDNQILIGKQNMCNSWQVDKHSLAQQMQLGLTWQGQQELLAPLIVFSLLQWTARQ